MDEQPKTRISEFEEAKITLAKARELRELASVCQGSLKNTLVLAASKLLLGDSFEACSKAPQEISIFQEMKAEENYDDAIITKEKQALENKRVVESFLKLIGEKNIIGESINDVYRLYEDHCNEKGFKCLPIATFSMRTQKALNIKTAIRNKVRVFVLKNNPSSHRG